MTRWRELAWWLAFSGVRALLALLVLVLLWPMRLLAWLTDVRDGLEVDWLLARAARLPRRPLHLVESAGRRKP